VYSAIANMRLGDWCCRGLLPVDPEVLRFSVSWGLRVFSCPLLRV